MTDVTYINPDGTQKTVDANDNSNVMQTALYSDIPGIIGECGGGLVCSTCHVYVAPEFVDHVGQPSAEESEMLEVVAAERRYNSRLSCQITIRPELAGLVVIVPETQY